MDKFWKRKSPAQQGQTWKAKHRRWTTHRNQGADVRQASVNWRYYFSPQCQEDQNMKVTHFVETTHEKYTTHVNQYVQGEHGGQYNIIRVDTDPWTQVKVYHNPAISDIGRRPKWILVALALLNTQYFEHSQWFVLKEVELGVTHEEVTG